MSQPILRIRIPNGKKIAYALSVLLLAFSLSLNEKAVNAQVNGQRAPSLEIQRINQLDRDIDKRIDERFSVVHAFLIFISITITIPVFFLLFA
jgi:ABC-type spermidine/putrescine transport system permease subunit II